MTYTEQTLTCRDCGQPFAFTVGEQEFYASRGLTNTPGRCPECRAARKSGGGYGSGRGSSRGYDDRAPREMHEARCDSCGGVARVPQIEKLAEPIFGLPVSIGQTSSISGLKSALDQPEFATAIGLVRFGSFQAKKRAGRGGLSEGIKSRVSQILRAVKK